jgi:hypothetical protein
MVGKLDINQWFIEREKERRTYCSCEIPNFINSFISNDDEDEYEDEYEYEDDEPIDEIIDCIDYCIYRVDEIENEDEDTLKTYPKYCMKCYRYYSHEEYLKDNWKTPPTLTSIIHILEDQHMVAVFIDEMLKSKQISIENNFLYYHCCLEGNAIRYNYKFHTVYKAYKNSNKIDYDDPTLYNPLVFFKYITWLIKDCSPQLHRIFREYNFPDLVCSDWFLKTPDNIYIVEEQVLNNLAPIYKYRSLFVK